MDDVHPPKKVTDYSSSSEESDTTDEDDDEEVDQEAGEESTSGPEDSRAVYVDELNSSHTHTLNRSDHMKPYCKTSIH